ncbi:hypothetical protein HDV04_000446 [Boothiomyces sp. JEL0838]|nr:hypothetical protein HDV04_000446 [Boothiomyces sp. JEL0838]
MCGGSKNPDGPAAVAPQKAEANNTKADSKPSELTPTTAVLKRQPTKKFLEAILQSKELSQALESFLQAEFCLENLLFIQRTGNYREAFKKSDLDKPEDRQKLEQLSSAIMNDFMLPTSEREVNIPAKPKRDCLIGIETLKAKGMKMETEEYSEMAGKLFDQCENHVKTVLVQERIGRFQTTPAFQNASQGVQL